MGLQILKAFCSCGYKVENISYGATMAMCKQNIDDFPAYCNTCGELNGVDINAEPISCSKCFSTDINLYDTPKMTGQITEPDLSSDRFHRCHALWNETLEMMANDGEIFVPLNVDQYRQKVIENHNKAIENAENPIFIRDNYCPNCKKFGLRFSQPLFGFHYD